MRHTLFALGTTAFAAIVLADVACSSNVPSGDDASIDAAYDAPPNEPLQTATITATVGSTRFITREHFLASAEMQISGEPLAETMGRELGDYSRDSPIPNLYADTSPNAHGPWIDLPGFSTGIESYEYSKQPMNNVAFESGAGTSLVYGPLVNASNASGAAATAQLAALVEHYAKGSNAFGAWVFTGGTYPTTLSMVLGSPRASGNPNLHGTGTGAQNPLGWPGIWPTVHVFESFDPTIAAVSDIKLLCVISADDNPKAGGGKLVSADYECDYTTLHLPNRAAQINPVITPGADGFSAWKYGLWVLNYLQVMHDSTEGPVAKVAAVEIGNVGTPGNQIIGTDNDGVSTIPGTFLGSSNIEGFQSQMFITEIENRAEDWLSHLTTADGATLSGFASLNDALAYAYDSPLRWFPGQVAVSEAPDGDVFPKPAYSLASAKSTLLDLDGLVLGYATFYALTDTRNADVGGSQPARCFFDGDPFPADNQLADGESTLHDRALAMMRVALVNMDRLHGDPSTGVLVDDVSFNGATPQRGTAVATTSVAYTLMALRAVVRTLSSQLELYSNNTPDTALATTPLDALPTHHPDGLTFSAHAKAMLRKHGDLLYDKLTDASGRAFSGWDVSTNAVVDQSDSLDAHAAAIRGLFATYLATGNTKYRGRAIAVFDRMNATFYDAGARIYSATPAPVDSAEYTPMRFALLQSALRDMYELVAARPGGQNLKPLLEARLARVNKLVLNGWDDRDENRLVGWPNECVGTDSNGVPTGGLQMAERTLTGETGCIEEQISLVGNCTRTSDREHDCVPEIDDARLPAGLASSVTFHIGRP